MDARPIQTEYQYPTAFSGWGREEIAAINRVVASDHYTCGPEVEALEHEFAAYHGMKYGIATNSGSSANLVSVAAMMRQLFIKPGDMVAVPALAWATTYAPLVQHGLNLKLIDCGPSWNCEEIDVGDAKLVVLCSILGNPIDWPLFVSKGQPFAILDDNCESIGATYSDGTLCGTQGTANTYSFYWSHQLSAIEGGMILTNDEMFARSCKLLRNHGWSRGLWPQDVIEDEFTFFDFGYNVRPLELNAAIAREQLRKLDQRIIARWRNWEYWWEVSAGLPLIHPMMHGSPSPFGIHFQVESREIRQKLANVLRANGIDCRPPVAGSFRLQPYGKRWADQQTPNADRIHETGLMLGNPPFDGTQLIDMAVKVMKETL